MLNYLERKLDVWTKKYPGVVYIIVPFMVMGTVTGLFISALVLFGV